ncbi:MAG TPA: hypothetical protein VFP35_02450 [Candidatus Saccharimonadales bacterium]|nr:hypothetical protein [Candidatus Saccharimonadales bacterium]
MAEEDEDKTETVKIELELPKEAVSIEGDELKIKQTECEDKKEDEEKEKEESEGEKKSGKEPGILGYKTSELAKIPAEAPEPTSKKPANPTQTKIILTGFIVIIIGIACWVFLPFFIGLAIAIAGAVLIIIGTLGQFE